MGTLGKALGAFGAYVAGERRLVQFLLNRARSYVFTTAPAPATCGAALAALRIVQSPEGSERRARLAERSRALASALKSAGLTLTGGDHQLMAVRVGSPRAAMQASAALEQAGFLVRAVRPPTVPEGTSRLRLCVSAGHTPEDIASLAQAIGEVLGSGAPARIPAQYDDAAQRQADLKAKDFKNLWHPFTQMQGWFEEEPLIIERAEGSTLIDVLGNRYLDGVASLWANIHGHRRPEIDAAVAEQLTRFAHSTLLGLSSAPAIELAEALVRRAPAGLTRVFFSDNGSSATEIALKMAFQYFRQRGQPERRKFLAFGEAYHGDTIGAVSAGGIDLFHDIFRQLLFEVVRAPPPSRDPAGQEVLRLLAQHASELAAVVVEPLVQGAAGMLLQPKGYLKKLREACDAHGVLLIADEVATGFGRTGTFFAVEQEDVRPDLLCLAKGITGGYLPLAATLAREEIFEGFLGPYESRRTFFHGHTYTGNALGCAAALASLRIFDTDRTLERLQPKIARLADWLEGLRGHAHVVDVRQCGFMAGIELVEEKSPRRDYPAKIRMGHQVTREARRNGAVIRPLGDVVVLMPPLSMSEPELDRLLEITARAIETATSIPRG
jgi:adenosylmethionine-8-amino-7-oxononanoate aminotransferase